MEKLYEDEYIEIQYDSENHWIYSNWQNYQKLHTVQKKKKKMLAFLKEKNCSKVLNDNRLVKGTWSFASDWVAKDWFPRMIEAGLNQFAWIYSPDAFSKFSTDKSAKNTEGDIIMTFNSIEEGKAWLKSA